MEQFMAYLDTSMARLLQESSARTADERKDEGDLLKVRANVYGICKSIFQVLDEKRGRAKLNELENTWEKALEEARKYGDVKKTVIEEIKIETLNEIMERIEI